MYETEHRTTVLAPAPFVFGLLADVTSWPVIFPPTIHTEYLERGEADERLRLWATANGEVKNWTSRRHLDRTRLRIAFRQEVSAPPVAAMGGEWIVEPLPDGASLVRLTHDFRPVDDDPASVDWIVRAVDRNSHAELDALKTWAEQQDRHRALLLSFADVVRGDGAAEDVYDFIYRAQAWPERLPHVSRVDLREDTPGVQLLEMDTRTRDGSTHTTTSVRVCFPTREIVYKQLQAPALMTAHTGRWLIAEDVHGVEITSIHTVIIKPSAIPTILGEDATVDDARTMVRKALGQNSTITMQHASEYARGRHRAAATRA